MSPGYNVIFFLNEILGCNVMVLTLLYQYLSLRRYKLSKGNREYGHIFQCVKYCSLCLKIGPVQISNT